MSDSRPVGVFDSGVGGLSVLGAVRHELPSEDLVYVADSGYAPYGDKPREYIEARAIAIVEFLRTHDAKAVVVACNTATGAAVDTLRNRYTIPIVAMEPPLKPAVTTTKSGVVGVLATTSTLSSAKFLKLVDAHGKGAQILIQPCPGLVECVERGDLAGPQTRALVERFVGPLRERGADTIVLGCTHYPFVRPVIEELMGPDAFVFDPASAVARELRRRLAARNLLADDGRRGRTTYWTSGNTDDAGRVMSQLVGERVEVQSMGARSAP
jgi:glutamate racemase